MTFQTGIKKCPFCHDLMFLEPIGKNLAGIQPINRIKQRSKNKVYFCCQCMYAETAGKEVNLLLKTHARWFK